MPALPASGVRHIHHIIGGGGGSSKQGRRECVQAALFSASAGAAHWPSPLQNIFRRPLEQGTTHGHPPRFAVSLPSPLSPPEQIRSGLPSLLMLLSHPAAGASLLSNVSTIQIKLQGAQIQLSSSHLRAAAEGRPRTNRNPHRGTTHSCARGEGGSKDTPAPSLAPGTARQNWPQGSAG